MQLSLFPKEGKRGKLRENEERNWGNQIKELYASREINAKVSKCFDLEYDI